MMTLSKFTLLTLCFLFSSLTCSTINAQCNDDEEIDLETQADVDSFPINYGYSYVEYDIYISGSGIWNLDSLYMIDTICGNLNIDNCDSLIDLKGLENLKVVYRDVRIEGNDSLETLEGLNNLIRIGGDFQIESNPILSDISSIDSSIIVNERLEIVENPLLTACGLYWVCNQVLCGVDVNVYENGTGCFETGEAFLRCSCEVGQMLIPFDVDFTSQELIDSLPGIYRSCPFELDDITIDGSGIISLDSLYVLEVLDRLEITNCDSLLSLDGIQNLMEVGDFSITSNAILKDISAVNTDISFFGTLVITSNDSLNVCDLEWVCNAVECSSYYAIENNGDDCFATQIIPKCPCISNAKYVDFTFNNQAQLDSFPQQYQQCGGIIRNLILKDGTFTNLDSLYPVTDVVEELRIDECDRLKNLRGLHNLKSVGIEFRISDNDSLLDLDDLDSLRFVGNSFEIRSNEQLEDISGIDSGIVLEGDLSINNNDSLNPCGVIWLCNFLSENFNNASIGSNHPDCESEDDVLLSCDCNSFESYNYYELNSQEEVDSFHLMWLECPSIISEIQISGNNIKNLDSLYFLDTIYGYLYIEDSDSLTDLSGLMNLRQIWGGLIIRRNDALLNLDDFSPVLTIGYNLEIIDNSKLEMCPVPFVCKHIGSAKYYYFTENGSECESGLEVLGICACEGGIDSARVVLEHQWEADSLGAILKNCPFDLYYLTIDSEESDSIFHIDSLIYLDTIFESLNIRSNEYLSNLSGLDSLRYIGDFFGINNYRGNDTLTGFGNLKMVGGSFNISGTELSDIASINPTVRICGDLNIRDNDNLKLCNVPWVCNFLTTAKQRLEAEDNDSLCNNALDIIESCGCPSNATVQLDISLWTQGDVNGFPAFLNDCSFNLHDLRILGVAEGDDDDDDDDDDDAAIDPIWNLDSLYVVDSVFDDLEIERTTKLMNLKGMENLVWVGDDVKIYNNSILANFEGLSGLTYIGDDLEVGGNNRLISFKGLDNLETINESLEVEENTRLRSLEGIENLKYINQNVDLVINNRLRSVSGFAGLEYVGNNFGIVESGKLTTLDGLENLRTVGDNFRLEYNDKLSSISALYQLDSIGGDLFLRRNLALSICNLPWICAHLQAGKPSTIYGNNPNCHYAGAILMTCSCNDILVLPDPDGIYRASNLIESLGDQIMIQSGIYDAPNVLLKPGFEVPKGTSLLILQEGCE